MRWMRGHASGWLTRISAVCLPLVLFPLTSSAAPHEVRLPLHDGNLQVSELSQILEHDLHLPRLKLGGRTQINLNGLRGSLFIHAIDASLGDACRLDVNGDELILHVDPDKLPSSCDDVKQAVREFVATDNPEATALQAKHWGLFLPDHVDRERPLVILIHGLNTGCSMFHPMGDALEQQGFQVAYFGYPSDQAIAESAAFLSSKLADLRDAYPGIHVDLVGHSMGGLVARAYVEGDRYAGDVDHLILVGTPNDGSPWATWHLAMKIEDQYQQWRTDPDWHLSWAFTDGMGEAGRDLKPHSKFLKHLNKLPRRDGVQYTIIAGDKSTVARVEANWIDNAAHVVPDQAKDWFALGDLRRGLEHKAEKLRDHESNTDGPVTLKSARLKGVDDFIVLPADHETLVCGCATDPPAALETIVDRLRK